MTKKIALIGAQGQLGCYLLKCLKQLEIDIEAGLDIKTIAISRKELDLSKTDGIQAYLGEVQPDLIINASAYTAVDKAETEVELAHQINCIAPAEMAAYAEFADIPLIHFSTDYVFAGDADQAYLESDATSPQGQYGLTKLAGEQRLLDSGADIFIFRTAWVYSRQGSNFYKTMLKLAESRSELNVVSDQVGSPTYAAAIAEASAQIVEKLLKGQQFSTGVYHMTCQGQTDWAQFARDIFELNGKQVKVNGIPSSEYPTPAKRPSFSVLNNQKLEDIFAVSLPSWQDALKACAQEINSE